MDIRYKDKKILILGLGTNQGGLGAAKFFAKQGAKLIVTDLKKEVELKDSVDQLKQFANIEFRLGEHRYEDIDWADIVIRNQALKPDNPYRIYAEKAGKEIETDVGIFLNFVNPKKIIGITGTKGKSTTATLIYEILKAGGTDVVFAGNIGKSMLNALEYINPNTFIVLEISSFQLEAFDEHKTASKWAVITNIFPDHLNYYKSMEEYESAKRIIAKYQTKDDYLILPHGYEIPNIKTKVIHFSPTDLPTEFKPILPGEHNKANIAAALKVTGTFGVDKKLALETAKNFKGVEFRLQLIKQWNGIKIYNDTTATGPDSAAAALKALPGSILIAGGVNKNLPYQELAKAIGKYAKSVYFLEGDATDEIKRQLSAHSSQLSAQKTYNNFEQILTDIKKVAKLGDVILFSPGAASFNLFQNEFDRGRKFNAAVEKVFKD